MKYTSAFYFSLLLLFCASNIAAQVNTDTVKASVPAKTDRYGLRLGVDLSKPIRAVFDKDYKGLEIVGDYRVTKKFWLAGELGNENKTTDDDQLNFTTKGTFFRVGFDYNAYENWLDME